MRYAEHVPADQLAVNSSDGMLLFTAVISVFIGAALIWMGRRGKIMWMWTWGIGLIVMSVYLGISVTTG